MLYTEKLLFKQEKIFFFNFRLKEKTPEGISNTQAQTGPLEMLNINGKIEKIIHFLISSDTNCMKQL